ncbi:MAG: hypothetical protein DRI23_05490, partial [Candidatus Cloacimonadota bacterium]
KKILKVDYPRGRASIQYFTILFKTNLTVTFFYIYKNFVDKFTTKHFFSFFLKGDKSCNECKN